MGRSRAPLKARIAVRVIAMILAAALAACTVVVPPAPTRITGEIAFVLANTSGVLALDAKGKILGPVIDMPKDGAASSPALFPNRKTLALSVTLVPAGGSGFGSDIWTVDVDGSNVRRLVEHERENVFFSSPIIDPTGNVLYFQRRAAVVQNGTYVGNEDSIERLELNTRQRTRVVERASDPTLAPDGRTLVYVRIVDGAPQGLWRVGTDGSDPRPFFSVPDTWLYLQTPRFAPDGSVVVFSGAGHNARMLDGGARLAHLGIPSELFLAPPDGRSVKSIGQTVDDVVPAWSPDGTHIAFVATGALQILTVADGTVRQLTKGDQFFFGDLVWLRP